MARADFADTIDLVCGPLGVTPYTVYASGPARFVPETTQFPLDDLLSTRVAYVTLDFATPNGPQESSAGQTFSLNYLYADWIAFPSGGLVGFRVLFVEQVLLASSLAYYRAHVQESSLIYITSPAANTCASAYTPAVGPGSEELCVGVLQSPDVHWWRRSFAGVPLSIRFCATAGMSLSIYCGPCGSPHLATLGGAGNPMNPGDLSTTPGAVCPGGTLFYQVTGSGLYTVKIDFGGGTPVCP